MEVKENRAITGGKNSDKQLLSQLISRIEKANNIDMIVSFLMETGVKQLLPSLKQAAERGAKIRIVTGSYLGITQPTALSLIYYDLKGKVDLRFYNDEKVSFHPKTYIFHYEDDSELFIGSSNMSLSALTSGIEWNYRFSKKDDPKSFDDFFQTFEDIFFHQSRIIDEYELEKYSKNWHMPAVYKDIERLENKEEQISSGEYSPRGAQIEALYALNESRGEGAKKALVVAATGIGKTYIAAFDSIKYKKVLFVAHREEILKQAKNSFKNVRKSDDFGFFSGNEKCVDKSVIFASVATLGRKEYLNERYFAKDYFDYIVIDEFHHSVSELYKNIIDYFEPQFLLGLTATPERLDGKNIFELCDYNVPYEIDLKMAINQGMLVPFHYYGIYDDIDYSQIKYRNGHYDESELTLSYKSNQKRFDLIYKHYRKYGSKRALGFCCSREHAEDMARDFNKRKINAVAVYSNAAGEFSEDREVAISELMSGEINVIFCVDMFNEGVDIPNVDMVMFLRPTESPTIFLQQLGRGLRKDEGKNYLNVLDFIGNYKSAGQIRKIFSNSQTVYTPSIEQKLLPDDCLIDFDMQLIDLFMEMDKKRRNNEEIIYSEFERIKDLLQKVPTRIELFTYMNDEVYQICLKNTKLNPFKDYLKFLNSHNLLTKEERKLFTTVAKDFLNLLETTLMSKVYKMLVLKAFYNEGNIKNEINEEDVIKAWKEFFDVNGNWKDLGVSSYQDYLAITDEKHLKKIKDMPIHFLLESGKGYFIEKENAVLALSKEIEPFITSTAFRQQMGDIINFRILDYYKRKYDEKNESNNILL